MQSAQQPAGERQSMIGVGIRHSGILDKFKQRAHQALQTAATSEPKENKLTQLEQVRVGNCGVYLQNFQ